MKNEIYKSFPDNWKSLLKDFGISDLNIFGFTQNQINQRTADAINDIYKKCINAYISRIINEEINQRKNNGGKLKFIDRNDLVNIKINLEGKLAFPNSINFNIIDLFKNFIYWNTPLYTALNLAFDNFKKQSNENNKKYLFIISDGELNDVDNSIDYISEITKKSKENKVIIISISKLPIQFQNKKNYMIFVKVIL